MSTSQDQELLDDLYKLSEEIFSERLDPIDAPLYREFDGDLWSTLTDAGLTRLTLAEEAGGSGATLREAAVVLGRAAAHGAPVPLAETDMLACWLLPAAGLDVPDGPLTTAGGTLQISGSRITGTLDRVPWARHASIVAALADRDGTPVVAALPTSELTSTDGANLAGEPRDSLVVDLPADSVPVGAAPADASAELRHRGALARSVALAAACSRAVELSVKHTSEREQFGRALSKLQAVQHLLAETAGEAATARAAADVAVQAATDHGFADPRVRLAVAIAKSRAGAAAGVIARTSHQLHGAIGFTLEHHLRLTTTRLWSWREEFGNEDEWNVAVAEKAMEAGPQGLWPLLTQLP